MPPGEGAECLSEIETAARRAAALISRLLSFARSRPRAHDVIEVEPLIDEAASLLRRTLPRNVVLRTVVEPGLAMVGDSSMLLQVLMNGCINAGQALPKGGHIVISASRVRIPTDESNTPETLTPGSYVRIAVEDDRIGMDAETLERAFQPFFTTKTRGEGTGLRVGDRRGDPSRPRRRNHASQRARPRHDTRGLGSGGRGPPGPQGPRSCRPSAPAGDGVAGGRRAAGPALHARLLQSSGPRF